MERNAPAVRDCNTLPGSFPPLLFPLPIPSCRKVWKRNVLPMANGRGVTEKGKKRGSFSLPTQMFPYIFSSKYLLSPDPFGARSPTEREELSTGSSRRQSSGDVYSYKGGGRKELLFRPGNFMQSGFTRTEQRGRRSKGRWRWWRGAPLLVVS